MSIKRFAFKVTAPFMFLVFAASGSGRTQAPASEAPTLTLAQVILETQKHSDSVRQASDALKAAKSRIGQQNAGRSPQLGIVGSAVQYDSPSRLNFGGQKFDVVPDHTEALSLQLNQLLDFSNQVGTAVAQARLLALASDYTYESTASDAALNATEAYYDELRAEQNVTVAQSALSVYLEQLKLNTKLYEGGTGPKINVLRAQSQVSQAESDLVDRQNQAHAAKSRINDLIGRPLDEPFTLVQPDAKSDPYEPTRPDRAALIQEALGHRTEILGAEVQSKAADKGIKLARSSSDPQVTIGLAGNYYPTTSFESVRETTAALTLGLTIPIYDGGLARDRVKEARANLDSAKAAENRTRRDVSLQVQNAALDLETAIKRMNAARVSLVAATAARDLAEQRYEAQVSVYLEVTDAQSALTNAQASLVNATFDLLTAQARLTRAVGQPLLK